MVNTTFITKDEARAVNPAIFANNPAPTMSNRYIFVDSESIIDSMDALGWGLTKVTAPKARKEERRAYGKHLMEFQSRSFEGIEDPRSRGKGTLFPRLHIINSHNGSTRLEASCGLFALVCSNGLVISRLHFGEVSLRHAGKFSQYDAMSAIMEFEKKMADIRDHVENFSGILLTQVEQETFARVAATARWGQEASSKMDVAQLLHRNRSEDDSNTLWATFNTLQENVIGGSARVGSRRSRPMKEMTRTQDLNQALWHGMETFAMNGTFSLPEGYSLN
jgi:hypothetical protein